MKTEMLYLVLVTALTGLLWVPYILDRIMTWGLIPAVSYPTNPPAQSPWAERLRKAHANAVENLVVFAALVALPVRSRPKTEAFDRLGKKELARSYARELARVFRGDPGIQLEPPRWVERVLGLTEKDRALDGPPITSDEAVDDAADRDCVRVTAL
jgi:hypothetical protein